MEDSEAQKKIATTAEANPSKMQMLQLDLAQDRTVLAMDRTLLAWIRTSLSLFAFGFTLARFVHDLIKANTLTGFKTHSPEQLGITLMLLGILGLTCGSAEHWLSLKRLNQEVKMTKWSSTLAVSIALIVISVLLLAHLMINLTPL